MPKSGPKELAAYHQQQMDKETKRMTPKTPIPHETLDGDAIAAAQQRLDDMNLPGTGIAPALMNGVQSITMPEQTPVRISEEARATLHDALPSRRRRSDAGVPRPPKDTGANVLNFSTSLDVPVSEFARWAPERMMRFFQGLAQAVAARDGK